MSTSASSLADEFGKQIVTAIKTMVAKANFDKTYTGKVVGVRTVDGKRMVTVSYPGNIEGTEIQSLIGDEGDMVKLTLPQNNIKNAYISDICFCMSDTTKESLGLSGQVGLSQVIYALSQLRQTAYLTVQTMPGASVSLSKDDVVLTGTANESGLCTLYPDKLGVWTLSCTLTDGQIFTNQMTVDCIGILSTVSSMPLDECSWALIGEISRLGLASKIFNEGDKKSFYLVGGNNCNAVIIGFDHDNLSTADGSRTKAGITFQLENSLVTTYSMNGTSSATNVGGWRDSRMRSSTLPYYYSRLPQEILDVLATVNKRTSAGNSTTTIYTTSDTLFLLSEIEIDGVTKYSCAGEGSQYGWYKNGGNKIKSVDGTAAFWWTRSPYSGNAASFCSINTSGSSNTVSSSTDCGVAFAFCI